MRISFSIVITLTHKPFICGAHSTVNNRQIQGFIHKISHHQEINLSLCAKAETHSTRTHFFCIFVCLKCHFWQWMYWSCIKREKKIAQHSFYNFFFVSISKKWFYCFVFFLMLFNEKIIAVILSTQFIPFHSNEFNQLVWYAK